MCVCMCGRLTVYAIGGENYCCILFFVMTLAGEMLEEEEEEEVLFPVS